MQASSEKQIKIRQITQVQTSWQEQERGKPGLFILQLILDNGADEYILRPDRDDADLLVKLFARSRHAMFDLERKIVMLGHMPVEE